MFRTMRSRLTYANVMATVAIFVAFGGSSYAALSLGDDLTDPNGVVKLEPGEDKVLLEGGPFTLTAHCRVEGDEVRAEVTAETTKDGSVYHADGLGSGPLPVGESRQLTNSNGPVGQVDVSGRTFILSASKQKTLAGYVGSGVNSIGSACFALATPFDD
jgi:hypothetical protein